MSPRKRRSGKLRHGLWAAAALFLACTVLPRPGAGAIVERIVAIVGERAILLSDLRQRSRPFLTRAYDQYPEGPQRSAATSQIYKVVLDRMVEEELEDEAAKRAGITVTSEEVDQALERVAMQNGLSPAAVLAEARGSGMTTEQYRDELKRQLLQSKIGSIRLQGRVQIEESDLRAAYHALVREERMQLPQRTLRLAIPAGNTPQSEARAQKLADELVRRAAAGEDFRELVRRYGTAPGTGLAEARPPLQEPEEIQRATVGLEVGGVSRPIRLAGVIMILNVLERAPSSLPPYDEVKDAVHERVYMEKMARVRKHWLDALRRRTYVEIRM
jgi:peptidyl-prolyl cis-trans isomerase SurA